MCRLFFRGDEMKATKNAPLLTWLTILSLVVSLCAGSIISGQAKAQPKENDGARAKGDKVSSDLRERVSDAQARDDPVGVILQLNGPAGDSVRAILKRNGVRVKGDFRNFNSQAVELPASVVDELSLYDEVDSIVKG